jgi:putative hemolysin
MSLIFLEIGIIAALLLVNALFSMSEMAVVSARKPRLKQLASEGNKGAAEALRLADSPNRFLSTIQIGITLVGVLSGAFGGATLSEQIARACTSHFAISADVATAIGVGSVVVFITFFSVVFGELIPKRLALRYPEKIATLTSLPMTALARISAPIVWIFSASTDFFLKILCLESKGEDASVTHDEIKAMVQQGAQEGVLEKNEHMMMERVLAFGKKRITSIMTLSRDIVWIDRQKPFAEEILLAEELSHSIFPIADGSLDNLLGTVHARDVCKCTHSSWDDLSPKIFQPIYIPETANALQVLDLFQKTGMQVGFVIDEFGAIQGLVTMTNLLEAIVGELPVGGVPAEAPIVKREDGSWLVDGALSIDSFKEHLGIERLQGEGENLFQTVAGFVMYRLGRVPVQADFFYWHHWRFEVLDMDRNRIDKVLVINVASVVPRPAQDSVLQRELPKVEPANPTPAP